MYPISDQTAKTSAEKFFEYICLLGTPEYLLTDLGTNFNSELFKEVSKKLGVTKLYTTPSNPKCNGANEITHRSLKKSISILARENSQWDDVLPFYEMIYNSTLHSTTKEKPSYLMLGYDIALPNSMLDPKYKPEYDSYPDYIRSKTSMLQNAYKNVHANILKAAQLQETYQGKTAKPRIYNPGDLAYIYNPQADRYATLPKKRNYTGPVRILKKHNPVNYTISYTNYPHRKPEKVNSERLIPYTERKSHLEYKQEDTAQPILPSPSHATYTMQEPEQFSHPKFSDDDSDNDEDNVPLLYLQTLYNRNRVSQNAQPPPVIQHNTPPSSPLLPTHSLNVQQTTTPHIHEKSTVQRQTTSTPLTSDDEEEDNIPLIQFTKSYNENRLIPQTSTGEKVTHPSQEVVQPPRKTLLPTPQPTYTTTFDNSITTPGIHYTSSTPSPPLSPSTVVYEYNPKINDDSQRKEPNSDKLSHNHNLRTRNPPELPKHTHDLRSGKTPLLPTPTHTDSGENNLAERIFNWALRITDTTEDDSKNKSSNDVD